MKNNALGFRSGILARRLAIPTEVFCRFPPPLQTNAGIVSMSIKARTFLSKYFVIHYSLIILPFDAIQVEIM
jgi:hypothetical protein